VLGGRVYTIGMGTGRVSTGPDLRKRPSSDLKRSPAMGATIVVYLAAARLALSRRRKHRPPDGAPSTCLGSPMGSGVISSVEQAPEETMNSRGRDCPRCGWSNQRAAR